MSEQERNPFENRPAEPVEIQPAPAPHYQGPEFHEHANRGMAPGPGRTPMLIAGIAVVAAVVVLLLLGRKKPETPTGIQPPARYAESLPITDLAMSESTSL